MKEFIKNSLSYTNTATSKHGIYHVVFNKVMQNDKELDISVNKNDIEVLIKKYESVNGHIFKHPTKNQTDIHNKLSYILIEHILNHAIANREDDNLDEQQLAIINKKINKYLEISVESLFFSVWNIYIRY